MLLLSRFSPFQQQAHPHAVTTPALSAADKANTYAKSILLGLRLLPGRRRRSSE